MSGSPVIRDIQEVKSYLRYAKFEEKMGAIENARTIYGRAIAELGEEAQTEEFYVAFAAFEERCKEVWVPFVLSAGLCSALRTLCVYAAQRE